MPKNGHLNQSSKRKWADKQQSQHNEEEIATSMICINYLFKHEWSKCTN
jgi:hypothetical protein